MLSSFGQSLESSWTIFETLVRFMVILMHFGSVWTCFSNCGLHLSHCRQFVKSFWTNYEPFLTSWGHCRQIFAPCGHILGQFEQFTQHLTDSVSLWSSFGLLWTHYAPFLTSLSYCRPFLSHCGQFLNNFGQVLSGYGPIFVMFYLFWTILELLWTFFRSFWTFLVNLNRFQLFWTSLGIF